MNYSDLKKNINEKFIEVKIENAAYSYFEAKYSKQIIDFYTFKENDACDFCLKEIKLNDYCFAIMVIKEDQIMNKFIACFDCRNENSLIR